MIGKVGAHAVGELSQDRRGSLRQGAGQTLVRKIDLSFDQRGRLNQLPTPSLVDRAQLALGLAERLAALALGFGVHKIGQTLRLREVEFAMLKGAAGEFSGLCRPHAFLGEAGVNHGFDHSRPAMDVKLGDMLAGKARRRREPQRQTLV